MTGDRGWFEWWGGLPWQLRAGVALLFVGISTALWLADRMWIWGWVIGGILLFFSFPNDAEKRGYQDF